MGTGEKTMAEQCRQKSSYLENALGMMRSDIQDATQRGTQGCK